MRSIVLAHREGAVSKTKNHSSSHSFSSRPHSLIARLPSNRGLGGAVGCKSLGEVEPVSGSLIFRIGGPSSVEGSNSEQRTFVFEYLPPVVFPWRRAELLPRSFPRSHARSVFGRPKASRGRGGTAPRARIETNPSFTSRRNFRFVEVPFHEATLRHNSDKRVQMVA